MNPHLDALKEEYATIFAKHVIHYGFHPEHYDSQVHEVQKFIQRAHQLGREQMFQEVAEKIINLPWANRTGHGADSFLYRGIVLSELLSLKTKKD